MSRDELRESFFLECEDLLEVLDTGLNEISDGSADDETINSVFRAVHSIKGGAGAFALDELVAFAHLFETVLDDVRSEKLALDRELIALFLRSLDMLSDLVAASQTGSGSDPDAIERTCQELRVYVTEEEEEEEDYEPMAISLDLDLEPIELGSPERVFEIRFFPGREFYGRGNEATLLLRALSELGTLTTVCDLDDVPLLDDYDPEEGTLKWTITLSTEASESDIAEIFEFAADDCQLVIEKIESIEDETIAPGPIEAVQEAIAVALQEDESPAPLPTPTAEPSNEEPQIEEDAKSAPPVAALKDAPEKTADAPRATIRVDLDRVDRLINLVGELVVNQAMIAQSISAFEHQSGSDIKDGLDDFRRLTRDIQESVMAIRAQPVKPLFQRMSRIIREAAQATGKDVRLVTDGAETEVDKTVVERLADPLTHMIRNAVDHGLESPEKREAAGKPREGIVHLVAAHRSGRVVIEISDNGAGINRERVREIAIEKELISADASLADNEIDNLLFLPGFSTAKEVSNLSGRGVGMDVVRKSIQSLGGRISIASTPGQGTSLTISLPLTLAVVDGIVVSIADEVFVVPLTSVIETLKPTSDDAFQIDPSSWALRSRGQVIPIIDIGHQLGMRGPVTDMDDKVVLVTGNEDGSRSALIIDSVEDQRQVVIKSLEKNYGDVPGIAAATILGDGRIGLILDVDILVEGAQGGSTLGNHIAMAG